MLHVGVNAAGRKSDTEHGALRASASCLWISFSLCIEQIKTFTPPGADVLHVEVIGIKSLHLSLLHCHVSYPEGQTPLTGREKLQDGKFDMLATH